MTTYKQLHKVLKLHLKISRDPFVSKFFNAVWALASHDKAVERLLNEVYESDCLRYAGFIQRANPKLTKKTCELRATLILAQLEGLVLLVAPGRAKEKSIRAIERELTRFIDIAIFS